MSPPVGRARGRSMAIKLRPIGIAALGALMLVGLFVSAAPGAATTPDTLSNPGETGSAGLDIQQATRAADLATGTETITIQTFNAFTDAEATFFGVLIDTTGTG